MVFNEERIIVYQNVYSFSQMPNYRFMAVKTSKNCLIVSRVFLAKTSQMRGEELIDDTMQSRENSRPR
jgi:hypothetical protein